MPMPRLCAFAFALIICAAVSAQTADVSITILPISPDPLVAGDTFGYNVSVTNNGPNAATNVVITLPFPADVRFWLIPNPPSYVNCTTPPPGTTSGTVTCTAASFPAGATANIGMHAQPLLSATGPITMSASVSSSTTDPNPGNNNASAGPIAIGSTASADVLVLKTLNSPATRAPGGTVQYLVSLLNSSPARPTNTVITDVLPPSLLFQSLSIDQTQTIPVTCTTPPVGTSGTITCLNPSPMAFITDSVVIRVNATVAPNANGTISNTASAVSEIPDPVSSNSTATDSSLVVSSADVSIAKTAAPSSGQPGSTINYTITVRNNGPDAASNVVVTDDLPAGQQFVSATPSQGSCNAADPVVCSLGGLANGATATIALQTLVTSTNGAISNTATVTADNDPNSTNNSATAAVSGSVPTLSQWALLMLVAMLTLVALKRS